MLISRNLHKKNSDVSIETRSIKASLLFEGQTTKHTTVQYAFCRILKISGKIFSRRYELFRDSQESILGMVVCKFILLVFSGGHSLGAMRPPVRAQ